MLCCVMLLNYHGQEYADACRNTVPSLLVPYKCLCRTFQLSVGELELFPCPPSLQAYCVLDEGAAGLDES